jgi:hypothetical protein
MRRDRVARDLQEELAIVFARHNVTISQFDPRLARLNVPSAAAR